MTIREARKSAGLTQQAITDKIGIPIRTLQDWEAERRSCPKWCEKLIVDKIEELHTFKRCFIVDPERELYKIHYDGQKVIQYEEIKKLSSGTYSDSNGKKYYPLIEQKLNFDCDVLDERIIGFVEFNNE
ncbi:MAG: helix-turn-helix domain-containing protein [Eubacterium sp.]